MPRMLAEAPSWGSLGAGRAQIALPQGKREPKPAQLKINTFVPSSGLCGACLAARPPGRGCGVRWAAVRYISETST